MKVIDLLNKIANGEKVPKIIKYDSFIYWYDESEKDYYRIVAKDLDDEDIEYLLNNCFVSDILNDKVEIIEEDKPIKKLKLYTNYEILEDNIRTTREICFKINEIIDEVNKLKKESDK